MNAADALSSRDLDRAEPEPEDICIDCGAPIPIGLLRCSPCEDQHDAREQFDLHAGDPRRS